MKCKGQQMLAFSSCAQIASRCFARYGSFGSSKMCEIPAIIVVVTHFLPYVL